MLGAVIAQIDGEMAERLRAVRENAPIAWQGLLDEGRASIEMAPEPEIQRIMLLDGPQYSATPRNGQARMPAWTSPCRRSGR